MSESLSFEELLDRDGHLAFTNKGVSMTSRPCCARGGMSC